MNTLIHQPHRRKLHIETLEPKAYPGGLVWGASAAWSGIAEAFSTTAGAATPAASRSATSEAANRTDPADDPSPSAIDHAIQSFDAAIQQLALKPASSWRTQFAANPSQPGPSHLPVREKFGERSSSQLAADWSALNLFNKTIRPASDTPEPILKATATPSANSNSAGGGGGGGGAGGSEAGAAGAGSPRSNPRSAIQNPQSSASASVPAAPRAAAVTATPAPGAGADTDAPGSGSSVTTAGDYNGDFVVDAADYVVWRKSVGLTGVQPADGNNDLVVNQQDYDIWRANYGAKATPGAFSITPLSIPDADGNFTISWQASTYAQSYQVQVSHNADGSSPVFSTVTTATTQAFSGYPEGTFFVGITATNSAGTTPATNTNNEVVMDFGPAAQVIFVTTKNYAIDDTDFNPPRVSTFGSPHGADYHTTDDASQAGLLSSTWDKSTIYFKAMLTQPGVDLFVRADIGDGIFINTHGDIIAIGRNQLYAGPHTAPILDQNGNAVADFLSVWTGSTPDGQPSGFTGGGWMDPFSSGATVGRTNGSGSTWLSNDVRGATISARLYGIGAIAVTNLTIHSSPLTLTTPIADQNIASAAPFNLNVASNFAAGSDLLQFFARQTSGVAIPAWLSFNSTTGAFTGTPPAGAPATFNIEVIARNELSTATVSDQFQLTVTG